MLPISTSSKRLTTFARRVVGLSDLSHAWLLPDVVDLVGGVSLVEQGTHLTTAALFEETDAASRVEESGYWELASPPVWDQLDPWTLVFAVRPDKTGTGNLTLYSTWDNTAHRGIHTRLAYTATEITIDVFFASAVGNRLLVSSGSPSADPNPGIANQEEWVISIHYDGSGDASGIRFALNGHGFCVDAYGQRTLIDDTLSGTTVSGNSAYIGRHRDGGPDLFRGDVQAVALFNRDLDFCEAAWLSQAGFNYSAPFRSQQGQAVLYSTDADSDSDDMKDLAKMLDVHVLALAQIDRQIGSSADHTEARPRLAHLRGSGDLENAPDNVLFFHRPEYFLSRQTPPKKADERADSRDSVGRWLGMQDARTMGEIEVRFYESKEAL